MKLGEEAAPVAQPKTKRGDFAFKNKLHGTTNANR